MDNIVDKCPFFLGANARIRLEHESVIYGSASSAASLSASPSTSPIAMPSVSPSAPSAPPAASLSKSLPASPSASPWGSPSASSSGGEIDWCRALYTNYLKYRPHNCKAWEKYTNLERSVGETEVIVVSVIVKYICFHLKYI